MLHTLNMYLGNMCRDNWESFKGFHTQEHGTGIAVWVFTHGHSITLENIETIQETIGWWNKDAKIESGRISQNNTETGFQMFMVLTLP